MTKNRNRADDDRLSYRRDSDGRSARNVMLSEGQEFNSISVSKTTVTTTATRIATPDEATSFSIISKSGDFYIGDSTVTTSTGYPLLEGEILELGAFQKGDNNEIYGIVASTDATVYAIGSVKV